MRVQITAIVDRKGQDATVALVTPYGSGRAIWRGHPPVTQQVYDCELSIGDTLRWSSTIVPAESGEPAIYQEGHDLVVSGQLDQINSDGSGAVRIGESIVLFASIGEPPERPSFVRIRTTQAVLYDSAM